MSLFGGLGLAHALLQSFLQFARAVRRLGLGHSFATDTHGGLFGTALVAVVVDASGSSFQSRRLAAVLVVVFLCDNASQCCDGGRNRGCLGMGRFVVRILLVVGVACVGRGFGGRRRHLVVVFIVIVVALSWFLFVLVCLRLTHQDTKGSLVIDHAMHGP